MVRGSAEKALRRLKGGPAVAEPVAADEEAAVLGIGAPSERRSPAVVPQSLPFQQPPAAQPQARSAQPSVSPERPFEPHVLPSAPPSRGPVAGPEAELPGHTTASQTPVPPDLAKMWPEGGSLNGHDHPVPPPPPVHPSTGEAQAENAPPQAEEQSVAGLPDEDYAPGRTDQPSTMERLLGADEKPEDRQAPPAGAPAQAEPGDPLLPPPAPPPPPSGWK